ncbi:hypothetical protein C8J57DRAFT_1229283 [Mycena rebaudengoi]|nr:hypothetical protein C8J57DRAFT_1229283 [Mycena rebaudengoi]
MALWSATEAWNRLDHCRKRDGGRRMPSWVLRMRTDTRSRDLSEREEIECHLRRICTFWPFWDTNSTKLESQLLDSTRSHRVTQLDHRVERKLESDSTRWQHYFEWDGGEELEPERILSSKADRVAPRLLAGGSRVPIASDFFIATLFRPPAYVICYHRLRPAFGFNSYLSAHPPWNSKFVLVPPRLEVKVTSSSAGTTPVHRPTRSLLQISAACEHVQAASDEP